jgi:transposase
MASFLGIDLSKATFHACLLGDRAEAKKAFPNTSKGFEQLMAWLKNRHVVDVHICMEATGAYWEALASYLSWSLATRQRRQPRPHQGVRAERAAADQDR